ncbi:uncharacterized protein LOC129567809 [Sitodiplosis mosellana]|uniref:uncharacterized protein LOC129567809 n=1 Tax=Sitodiplosis mosellana TaxID=263140 RepID=UPI002444EE84|nr:uncharacterized protein LOC129567809 [Sitodiplosis mosellana]
MFRRKTKLDGDLPQPPTKAEILEDLETFSLDHVNRTQRNESALSTSDLSLNAMDSSKTMKRGRNEPESEHQLEEWWDKFEKFLSDIDQLEVYQKQFGSKKMSLAKLDETIGLMADDIQTRINDSLGKAMAQVPETEPDLK